MVQTGLLMEADMAKKCSRRLEYDEEHVEEENEGKVEEDEDEEEDDDDDEENENDEF